MHAARPDVTARGHSLHKRAFPHVSLGYCQACGSLLVFLVVPALLCIYPGGLVHEQGASLEDPRMADILRSTIMPVRTDPLEAPTPQTMA